MSEESLLHYLEGCRELVLKEIRRLIPAEQRFRSILYDLMLDYPLREAKGLRPALCIASCRALGGTLEAVLRSAAVLELYHNAFLIHDDIEDGSLVRRHRPTLHREHGIPIAINVGDAMFALSLQPLLENIELLGLGPALRILQAVARMARESVEGQALELDWVKRGTWDLSDQDYIDMVERKTGWYSFITPVYIGAVAAQLAPARIDLLHKFARSLAIAFQIQDDILNLRGAEEAYGKESQGDLWEGKRTLMLLHMMRSATREERAEAERILSLPRPPKREKDAEAISDLLSRLVEEGALDRAGQAELWRALAEQQEATGPAKTEADIQTLLDLIERYRSIEYAQKVGWAWAKEAERHLGECRSWLLPSPHRDFLEGLTTYVLSRIR